MGLVALGLNAGCSNVNLSHPFGGAEKKTAARPAAPQEAPTKLPPAAPPSAQTPTPAPVRTRDGVIKVGLLLPLTGPSEALGQAMLNAATLALFDFADPKIQLLPRDAGETQDQGKKAAEAALEGGADLILGPVFARAVSGAAEAAHGRANVVAFSTDRTAASPGVYLIGFLPGDEIRRVVGYAAAQGMPRIAALTPSTAYGERVREALKDAVADTHGELVASEIFPEQPTQMNDAVRRVAAALGRPTPGDAGNWSPHYQAVMLAEGGSMLTSLAALLPYNEIDTSKIRVLGTGLWDDLRIAREPTLVGGWFAAADPNARRDFTERYQKMFGKAPPRIASLAYDAVALAAVLVKENPTDPFATERLTQPQGFAGIDGIFRLMQNGLPERGLAVMEVQRSGFKIIDPAPTSFQTPPSF